MATKKDKSHYLARFYPGGYFHVYGRTNNREPLYRNDDQRQFFLEKYAQYLGDYVDTFAWCLMENHFHLLIRVKDENHLLQYITGIPELMRTAAQQQFLETPPIDRDYHTVLERQFTRLFTTYAMRVNAEQKRSGNLFYRPFKRVEVTDINHLVWLVYYIHSNPVKHGVYTKLSDYRWSRTRLCYPKIQQRLPGAKCWSGSGDWTILKTFTFQRWRLRKAWNTWISSTKCRRGEEVSSARASQMTPPAVIVKAEDVVSPEMSPARASQMTPPAVIVKAEDVVSPEMSPARASQMTPPAVIVKVEDVVSPEMSPARASQMTPPDYPLVPRR